MTARTGRADRAPRRQPPPPPRWEDYRPADDAIDDEALRANRACNEATARWWPHRGAWLAYTSQVRRTTRARSLGHRAHRRKGV